jgi:hypothetical protein
MYIYVCVCPGITLEHPERFQPNLVHTKNLMYVLYIFRREDGVCKPLLFQVIHSKITKGMEAHYKQHILSKANAAI